MRGFRAASALAFLFFGCEQAPRSLRPSEPFLPANESSERVEDLLRRGDADGALSILERALRSQESPEDLFHYGKALRLRGRLPEARAAFERAGDAEASRRVACLREIASIQLEMGDLSQAGKSLRQAESSPEERAFLRFLESWEGEAYRISGEKNAELSFVADSGAALPQIECRLEGVGSVPMLLDTGAGLCVLSHSLAKRIGLFQKVGGGILLDLEGKPLVADFGVIGRLEIGGIRVDNVPAVLLEDEALTLRLFGLHPVFRVQGAIGMGVLRHFRTTMDFPRRRATFSTQLPEGSKGLPLLTTGLTLYAPLDTPESRSSEGRSASRMFFRVDTGSNRSALSSAAIARWGWESRVRARVGYFGGAKGWGASLREVHAPGLRCGSFHWGALTLPVSDMGGIGELDAGGVLGIDLLQSLSVTIDPYWMTLTLVRG